MKILILTTVGRTAGGCYVDIFPSRWSTVNPFKCMAYYPYELAYLSTLLKTTLNHRKNGNYAHVKMIDGNIKGWDVSRYSAEVLKEKPDWVVLESCQLGYPLNRDFIRELKAQDSDLKVLMCGAYPTAYPQHVLEDGADAVAIGEYECSTVEFFSRLLNDNGGPDHREVLSSIPGIYPMGRRALLDINALPFPEDEDISRRDYCRMLACEYNELEVFATRGCVNMCNFCVAGNVYYGRPNYRTREVGAVIDEIMYLVNRYSDMTGIFFNEENHTLDQRFNFKLADAIYRNGLNHLKYECMTNFSTLNESLLLSMKNAGYYKIRIGIETLDETNSRQIFKTCNKLNKDKFYKLLEICKKTGMKIYGTITMGSLGATADSDRQTIDKIESLWRQELLQDFQVSICTPMPGTPFYDQLKEKGFLLTHDGSCYDGNVSAVVSYPHYDAEQITHNFNTAHRLMRHIMKENQKKGIHYSMYDRNWCRHIYALTQQENHEA